MRGFCHESTYNESKEWYTPKYIFDAIGIEFDLDTCSPGRDIVPWIPAKKHLTYLDNGLEAEWHGTVWMNPPYGTDTPKWMERLAQRGNGIALVFSRTDTNWFHQFTAKADAICFIKRRISFIPASQAQNYIKGNLIKNSGSGAGSMLVAYGKKMAHSLMRSKLGTIMIPIGNTVQHKVKINNNQKVSKW
jgi:hypothetical protein